MGLGLSICYRILNEHSVKIEIDSQVGKGTHFTLNFPVILDDYNFDISLKTPLTDTTTHQTI